MPKANAITPEKWKALAADIQLLCEKYDLSPRTIARNMEYMRRAPKEVKGVKE